MADVDHNLAVWNTTWDWSRGGDEWSAWWGDTPALWFGALLPRIHAFVPTGTILEIGPGYGRWTQYLKDLGSQLVIVDLAQRCIDHCRERFATATNIDYQVNDGRSLSMVSDRSVDFAFSFDSLVHAEHDVLEDYLGQLARKLKPDGVAFLHHSNLGDHRLAAALARRVPNRARRALTRRGILIDLYAWRAASVNTEAVATRCGPAGMACVSQEKISWEFGTYLLDALSVVTPRGSCWERPRTVLRNPMFGQEAARMSRLYARSSFPGSAASSVGGD